jgi:hypothetical protein
LFTICFEVNQRRHPIKEKATHLAIRTDVCDLNNDWKRIREEN